MELSPTGVRDGHQPTYLCRLRQIHGEFVYPWLATMAISYFCFISIFSFPKDFWLAAIRRELWTRRHIRLKQQSSYRALMLFQKYFLCFCSSPQTLPLPPPSGWSHCGGGTRMSHLLQLSYSLRGRSPVVSLTKGSLMNSFLFDLQTLLQQLESNRLTMCIDFYRSCRNAGNNQRFMWSFPPSPSEVLSLAMKLAISGACALILKF